ncbi:MAG: phage distal tail protein, Rcc01695 family [Devosia sp.]
MLVAFHAVRFPLDIALGARGGPERATDIVTLASGREERNSRWQHARRRYNAGYGVKSRADMQAVLAFFEERRGRFHSFLWRDGFDFSSNGTMAPGATDQFIGLGDGVRISFDLTKRYGANFDPYLRPVTKPVAGTVVIAVGGVAVPDTDYTVDALTGTVTFDVPPAPGAAATAGFLFDVPVRFDTDRLDIELSSFDAAEVPNIPLIEVRE